MARNRSACMALAFAARSTKPRQGAVAVMSNTVLSKPASTSALSISWASCRLNAYSGMPRALNAPGTSTVWPTSTTTRNAERWQLGAAGFAATGVGGWGALLRRPRRRRAGAKGQRERQDRDGAAERCFQVPSDVARSDHIKQLLTRTSSSVPACTCARPAPVVPKAQYLLGWVRIECLKSSVLASYCLSSHWGSLL